MLEQEQGQEQGQEQEQEQKEEQDFIVSPCSHGVNLWALAL